MSDLSRLVPGGLFEAQDGDIFILLLLDEREAGVINLLNGAPNLVRRLDFLATIKRAIDIDTAWRISVEHLARRMSANAGRELYKAHLSVIDTDGSPPVSSDGEFKPGDLYVDGVYHPCLCCGIDPPSGDVIWGISLVDGVVPHAADIGVAEKLDPYEAWVWRKGGPQGRLANVPEFFSIERRWWLQR